MARVIAVVVILLVAWLRPASGNNIMIRGEAKVQVLLEEKGLALVTFPLSWEHSWRGNQNWDAAYIFMKYRLKGDEKAVWHHAYLYDSNKRDELGFCHKYKYRPSAGNAPMDFLSAKTDCANLLALDTLWFGNIVETPILHNELVTGVYFFRRQAGEGNLDFSQVQLIWNYNSGDLHADQILTADDIRNRRIEVSVQAIEMVFVPSGPFALGDWQSQESFVSETNDGAFLMENDGAQTVYTRKPNTATGTTPNSWEIPELFPTGYGGFYTMKYEVSQEQYVNFLNRLTYADQMKRIANTSIGEGNFVFGVATQDNNRNGIFLQEKYTDGRPWVFGFDMTPDRPVNILNSEADGKSVPCGFLTQADMLAYCDWAGLRPLSEMEYEKSCRERTAQMGDYSRTFAWGTADYVTFENDMSMAINDSGKENETVNLSNGAQYGRMHGPKRSNGVDRGPVRCGAFADATSDMYKAGASIWGVMELSGNLGEMYYNAEDGSTFNGDNFGDGNIWSSVATWRTTYTVQGTSERFLGWGNNSHRCTREMTPYCFAMPTINRKNRQMTACVRWKNTFDCGASDHHYDVTLTRPDLVIPWPVLDWPTPARNFIVRGGNYESVYGEGVKGAGVLAVSYRADHTYTDNVGNIGPRQPNIGFRGGRSVPMQPMICSEIQGDPETVICAAKPYHIVDLGSGDDTRSTSVYSWEMMDKHLGEGWSVLDNSDVQDLTYSECLVREQLDLRDTFKFRRRGIASHYECYTDPVEVVVPGYSINEGDASVTLSPYSDVVSVVTKLGIAGDIKVEWKKAEEAETAWRTLGNYTGQTENTQTITRSDLDVTGGIPVGNGGDCRLRYTITMDGCVFTKILSFAVRVQAFSCPPTVTSRDGSVTYQLTSAPDGNCWMKENSKELVDGTNTRGEYSFAQLMHHMVTGSRCSGESYLCPEGFAVPTATDMEILFSFIEPLTLTRDQEADDCPDDPEDIGFYIGDKDVCGLDYEYTGIFGTTMDNFIATMYTASEAARIKALSLADDDNPFDKWWLYSNIPNNYGYFVEGMYAQPADNPDMHEKYIRIDNDGDVSLNGVKAELNSYHIRCYKCK